MNPSTLKLFLIIVFHSFMLFYLSGTPVTILLLLLQVFLTVNFSLEFPTLRVLEECPIVAFTFLLPFMAMKLWNGVEFRWVCKLYLAISNIKLQSGNTILIWIKILHLSMSITSDELDCLDNIFTFLVPLSLFSPKA